MARGMIFPGTKTRNNARTPRWTAHTVFVVDAAGEEGYTLAPVVVAKGVARIAAPAAVIDARTRATLGYRSGRPAVFMLSRRDVLIKWIRVPARDPKQLAAMMPFESAALAPWPPEETLLGYETQEVDGDYTRVLLVMARRDLVEGHIAALHRLGIYPTRVEVSTAGLVRALSDTEDSGPVIVAAVGASTIEYLRVEQGRLAFSRESARNGDPWEALKASIDLDRRRNSLEPDGLRLLVAGTDGLPDDATLRVNGSAIPLVHLQVEGNAVTDTQARAVAAKGLALRTLTGPGTANLLPEKSACQAAVRCVVRRGRWLTLAALWVVAALGGIAHHYFAVAEARALEAEAIIAELERRAGDLAAKHAELDLLAGERRAVTVPLRVILDLFEHTPLDVAVNQMRYDARRTLVLGAEAPGYEQAFAYVDALRQAPTLRNVQLEYGSAPNTRGASQVEFQVNCAFRKPTASETHP